MDLAGLDKVRSARFIRMEEEKILLHEILWCDRDEHYIQVHTDKRLSLIHICPQSFPLQKQQ